VLGSVDVQIAAPPDNQTPSLEAGPLKRALWDRLNGTGLFSSTGPVARFVARVGTEVVEAGAVGEARAVVGIQLDDGRPDAPDGVSFKLEGRGSERYAIPKPARKGPAAVPAPDRVAILNRLVLRIAGDLIDGYVARRQLERGPPAVVHAALQADGGALRDDAVRVVGERKLHDEAPTLLKLLSDPDERTRDAALGSLIALGDRRAVSELTRTRSLRDRHEMRKMIEAIAILGGQEADQYLSFVAATHDDDEIRAEAAAARARLQRRENDAVAPRSE
jgi:HEAT repeat protein